METQSIGIDVGKTELMSCIRDAHGVLSTPALFPNSSVGFKKFLVYLKDNSIASTDPILLESTGPYHWHIASFLKEQGYLSKVANPLHTKQIARLSIRKRKTDKVDAGQIAFLASQDYGYRFVETEEMARKKALVRHYFKLKGTATSYLLHERYLKEYRGISRLGIFSILSKKCDELKESIVTDWSKGNDLKYLDSIPGVSPFIAAVVLAELTPLDRFEKIDQIIAFAGLDPSVKQSGGKPGRHGSISKRGSPVLRSALYLASFGSLTHKPMRVVYDRYKARGLAHNTVLCVMARKILRIGVSLLKKRRVFDVKYLTEKTLSTESIDET